MSPSRAVVAALALALLSAPARAGGQGPPPPKPTPTPGRLDLPRRPAQLRIFGASLPPERTARGGAPLDFTTNVSVRNDGQQTGHFYIQAEIEGVAAAPRSERWSVGPGTSRRVPLRIQVHVPELPGPPSELPIVLRLMDTDGAEIHRYDLRLAYRPPPNPLFTRGVGSLVGLAGRPWRPTAEPNLMLVTASIPDRMERGTQELGSRGGRRVRRTGFVNFVMTARVRNTTTTRWGYPARVQFHVSLGTPETGLRAIGGEERSDGSADVPGDIEPGGVRDLTVTLPWAGHLQRGLWHTLSVWIVSSVDAGDADNGFRVVFMYDTDGRLVAQRSMVAPEAGLTATVRR